MPLPIVSTERDLPGGGGSSGGGGVMVVVDCLFAGIVCMCVSVCVGGLFHFPKLCCPLTLSIACGRKPLSSAQRKRVSYCCDIASRRSLKRTPDSVGEFVIFHTCSESLTNWGKRFLCLLLHSLPFCGCCTVSCPWLDLEPTSLVLDSSFLFLS